jgi:hypothetical protein
MIYKILTVIGLATFEIYAAIPAGFAFKLNSLGIKKENSRTLNFKPKFKT